MAERSVGIERAFLAWSRTKPFPNRGKVVVGADRSTPFSEDGNLAEEPITEMLCEDIHACFLEARRRRREKKR